ncbi:hypothetical protein AB0L53_31770 [Nonomuraea sp. NPDC052129]|uniref:hypothetical protein n=1 Tax=Nonomuraea sp. NPDC052129 TaxID=3154651 RepID=UPI003421B646
MTAESMLICESIKWKAAWRLAKFWGDDIGPDAVPYDVIERAGNLLMHGGASMMWQALIGNGNATPGQALTYFNNANAFLGVGDSSAAAAATQTDLQAASNKVRKAMDSAFPQHTDGTTPANATVTFRSTFATADANFAWNEWGIFNGAAGGRMLNRKVETLGSKTSAASWVLTVTLTLA